MSGFAISVPHPISRIEETASSTKTWDSEQSFFEDGILYSMIVRSRQIENQPPLSWLVFFGNDTKGAVLKKWES